MNHNEIYKKIKKLKINSYAPYSKFRVAAIVETDNNDLIAGVNVENASYPVGVCAERVALSQVYAQGFNKSHIKHLYLIGSSKDNFTSPCGMCCQFIIEVMDKNKLITIFNDNGETKTIKIGELLPFAFQEKDLKNHE